MMPMLESVQVLNKVFNKLFGQKELVDACERMEEKS